MNEMATFHGAKQSRSHNPLVKENQETVSSPLNSPFFFDWDIHEYDGIG
jgi:hypothetical protein